MGFAYINVIIQGSKASKSIKMLADTGSTLLGVYALETLGFKVNPKTGSLEEIAPEGGYLLLEYL